MGKIGPSTNSRAVSELYYMGPQPHMCRCLSIFLHFSVYCTPCSPLIDVTSVWFFCSGTKLRSLCPLPVYWETENQQ